MLPQNTLSFSGSCSSGHLMIPKDSTKSVIGSHRDSFQTSVSVDCQPVQLVSLQTFCCSQGWCFRRLISACSTTTQLRQPFFLCFISKVPLHSNFCMHKTDKESCVLCDRSNPPILEGLLSLIQNSLQVPREPTSNAREGVAAIAACRPGQQRRGSALCSASFLHTYHITWQGEGLWPLAFFS